VQSGIWVPTQHLLWDQGKTNHLLYFSRHGPQIKQKILGVEHIDDGSMASNDGGGGRTNNKVITSLLREIKGDIQMVDRHGYGDIQQHDRISLFSYIKITTLG
jgi:hypothetical protein